MLHKLTIVREPPELKYQNIFFKNGKLVGIFLFIFILAWTTWSALQLKKLSTTYSIKQFMPKADKNLKQEFRVKKLFHLEEAPGFLLALTLSPHEKGSWSETHRLSRLQTLVDKLKSLENVNDVMALSNIQGAVDSGKTLNVGSIVSLTPERDRASRIAADPLLSPTLLSADGSTLMVVVNTGFLNVNRMVQLEDNIRHLSRKVFPKSEIQIGGVPAIQSDISVLLLKELTNFVAFAFIVALISLMMIFSNFSGVFITLLIMGAANIIAIGGFAYLKIPFTVLSTTIPILTSITVLAISTHTLLRIDEEVKKNHFELKRFSFILEVLKKLFLPNLLSALTTCVGFLTLFTSTVPVIQYYGVETAVSVMVTWFFTQLALLSLLMFLPMPKVRRWTSRRARWSLFIMKFKNPIIISILLISTFLVIQGSHLNWSPKLFDDLPRNHPTRVATERIDRDLGGTLPLDIVVKTKEANGWNDPLHIAKLESFLTQTRLILGVGSVVGLSDFLHGTHLRNHDHRTRKSIAETYFLYSLAAQDPLKNFLTPDGRSTHIAVRMHDLPARTMQKQIAQITNLGHQIFSSEEVIVTGMATNVHRLNENLSKDLIFGFWQAMLIIGGLLILVFRSLKWALVACVPNLISPAVLIGSLALSNTPVKPGIALIFSIALGLSFNNTVYLLERIRQLATDDKLTPKKIKRAFYFESNPCIVSTLVIFAGFTVFLASYFSMNKLFGAFMLLSIIGGVVGDLVLLPAVLVIFPQLLHRRAKSKEEILNFLPATKVAASVAIVFLAASAYGIDNSRALLQKAHQQIASKDETANVKIRIIESDGSSKERQLEIKRKSGAKNLALVRLTKPSDLRGTAFLSTFNNGKEDQWLYLPSSKETRRIVGGNRQSGFLGSEVTYEDLSASAADGSQTKILKDVAIGQQNYSVIETRAKKGNSSYSRVLTWISKNNFLALKAEYYDWNNHLVKQISFQNYKKFGSVWRAQLVRIKNLQTKRGTDLILTDLSVNKNLPDSAFSIQALEVD